MLYHIIYFSKAVKLLTEDDLVHMLQQSRAYNKAHGLSGMMIYLEGRFLTKLEGRFMQVLEGPEDEVKHMFDKISTDERHHRIIVLEKGTIKHRYFDDWTMGFRAMNIEEYRSIPGFFELEEDPFNHDSFRSSSTALSFLKSFYETNAQYNYL